MNDAGRTRMYRLSIIAVLVLVIAAMAWKFIVSGTTRKADDGRTIVVLAPDERALMLGEMRGFVGGLQQIADALARDDMRTVATASRAMGMAREHDAPAGMLAKLPLEFKSLAFAMHRGFDTMATNAETVGSAKQTLAQLGAVLQRCVACHSLYQVSAATEVR
jgi:hypothetical protein